MPYSRETEVRQVLETDQTLLGRVYRYTNDGLTAPDIAELEGAATYNFVNKYRQYISALTSGVVPRSPTISRELASRVRSWGRRDDLSADLARDLQAFEEALDARATDPGAQKVEIRSAIEATAIAEQVGRPGVYVYTLPHYLNHPVDISTGRTLLKVGHSSTDALYRVSSQGRRTSLPEDPILLRIYPSASSASLEREFDAWLRAADYSPESTTRAELNGFSQAQSS